MYDFCNKFLRFNDNRGFRETSSRVIRGIFSLDSWLVLVFLLVFIFGCSRSAGSTVENVYAGQAKLFVFCFFFGETIFMVKQQEINSENH